MKPQLIAPLLALITVASAHAQDAQAPAPVPTRLALDVVAVDRVADVQEQRRAAHDSCSDLLK